jgi:hypothetical protein
MEVTVNENTVAYYTAQSIIAVKGFIVQVPTKELSSFSAISLIKN